MSATETFAGMESLFRSVGIGDEHISRARAAIGRQLRGEFEPFTERAAHNTMKIRGYEHVHVDQVRPNTRRAMQAILTTLEGADYGALGVTLREISYMRAKQGFPPRALFDVLDLTEDAVGDLATHCLQGSDQLMAAAIIARKICDGARGVILDGFTQAHQEAREEVERLARQFSAPILPALPGVLVLPIVGAISPARAQQIVDALLTGINQHGAHTAILDITGITDADPSLPIHLQRAATTARLLGAHVVLAGVSPTVARIIVEDAGGLHGVTVHSTLAAALVAAAKVTPATARSWQAPQRP